VTPPEIKALRHALGETTQQFGARFARSGRSVEDWEQGRRRPDPFILTVLVATVVAKRVDSPTQSDTTLNKSADLKSAPSGRKTGENARLSRRTAGESD
jgi:transcriptional regulator with XRE-family HTH domain